MNQQPKIKYSTHIVPSTGEEKELNELTPKELHEVRRALQEAERAKEARK